MKEGLKRFDYMILVFDLDDTLYDETTYVESGFWQAAMYLENTYKVPMHESYDVMIELFLKNGRGQVFDDLLRYYNLYSKKNIRKLVSVYRLHKPVISLYDEAVKCLARFDDIPIYIVTDGHKVVQKNKILALGLQDRVKHTFITSRFGIKHSKPSPYCFLKICEKENVTPKEVVYIGDNPCKDFVGIKPLGFKTIRILTGQYKDILKPRQFEANYSINCLSELTSDFLNKVFSK